MELQSAATPCIGCCGSIRTLWVDEALPYFPAILAIFELYIVNPGVRLMYIMNHSKVTQFTCSLSPLEQDTVDEGAEDPHSIWMI